MRRLIDALGDKVAEASSRRLVTWYALSAILVHVLPFTLRLRSTPWSGPAELELQSWFWTLAFVVTATGFALLSAARSRPRAFSVPLLLVLPWLAAYVTLQLRTGVSHSRSIAMLSVALGTVLTLAPFVLRINATSFVGTLVAAAGFVWITIATTTPVEETRQADTEVLGTALLPVSMTVQRNLVPTTSTRGGAIAVFGQGFLLANSAGALFHLTWDEEGSELRARPLSLQAPMQRTGVEPDSVGAYRPMMRVTGLVVDTLSRPVIVYVAHEAWRRDEKCLVLQVSKFELTGLPAIDSLGTWQPIFSTSPCLKPGKGFDPTESGGKLLLRPDRSLLMTVGDYGQNKVLETALAQSSSDYGKTLLIAPDGGRTLNTLGHRNPQGVTIDLNGKVWVAEHGPRGGDEVNLLERGANYGWPVVTYGTDYNGYRFRQKLPPRTHGEYREPAFALLPSVGISSLTAVRSGLFAPWTGDLLAGSLDGGQLLRFRTVGSRIVYVESVRIGRRIRDVAEGADGRIVLWTDVGEIIWLEPASGLLDGALIYEACTRCHNFDGTGRPLGPSLVGMFARPIASERRFEYSDALKAKGGRWTDDRLSEFLRNPAGFAPGTTMGFEGIADNAQRRVLVAYLKDLARGKTPP